ncbi:MAG: hypothetical protein ABFS56_21350 [Pseudomonadota bacterium]
MVALDPSHARDRLNGIDPTLATNAPDLNDKWCNLPGVLGVCCMANFYDKMYHLIKILNLMDMVCNPVRDVSGQPQGIAPTIDVRKRYLGVANPVL